MPIGSRRCWWARRPVHNEVRIIGGVWRSRRLRFPALPALRPTPDRVRETLFNWLQGELEGARCLDLYAGSGALGFEAASRGAAEVVAVDSDPRVCSALRRNCAALEAVRFEVVQADIRRFLAGPARSFQIVFMDPPYRHGFVAPACELMERKGWLADGAWIYLEAEAELPLDNLPSGWTPMRSKTTGDVGYHLYRRLQ